MNAQFLQNLSFTAMIFKEGDMYVSYSPELDVSSCGYNPGEAKNNLLDAVRGFLAVASEQGTLKQILEEAGFTKDRGSHWTPPKHISTDQASVTV